VFIGWGSEPVFSEFGRDGKLLFSASFPTETESYRAFRSAWGGQPDGDPAITAELGPDEEVTLYASWNGATEVAAWKVLAEGRAEDERWHIRKDGTRFWASGIMTPIRDEAGNVRGFVKIARDVTERREAEKRLQEAEMRYRTLVEQIPAITYVQEPPRVQQTQSRNLHESPVRDHVRLPCGFGGGRRGTLVQDFAS
jgi:PAS domain-containing protein